MKTAYRYIKDTGTCKDHGYTLDKSNIKKCYNTDEGVIFVDVPVSDLCKALDNLAKQHTNRLIEANIEQQIKEK